MKVAETITRVTSSNRKTVAFIRHLIHQKRLGMVRNPLGKLRLKGGGSSVTAF